MENTNEILVEETTEIVEESTQQEEVIEQPEEKVYTEAEFNQKLKDVLGKKIPRTEAKLRKEYDRKYGELVNVLRAGTGKNLDVEGMTNTFKEFYEGNGVNIPSYNNTPSYSDRDLEILARVEAEDIINSGFDDVVEEVDRLASVGLANMNPMEKEVFRKLAEYRSTTEKNRALAKIGVTEDEYNSKEFKEFANKFGSSTPITEVFDIYRKVTKPKKDIKPMGSMKNNMVPDDGVKEFYSYEEASKFTTKDFDKNPALYEAVKRSMLKWK